MITFERDGTRFMYRTMGVCFEDGWALLHRAERDDFWSLPGSRVEIGEESAAALRRELREELGVAAEVGRLLWMVKRFSTTHCYGWWRTSSRSMGRPTLTTPHGYSRGIPGPL